MVKSMPGWKKPLMISSRLPWPWAAPFQGSTALVWPSENMKTVRVEKQADYLLDPKKPLKDRMLICPDLIADFI
ncbi:MAG: hypothetical protein R6T90_08875, partial [Dissulfuribacterales bacterium]